MNNEDIEIMYKETRKTTPNIEAIDAIIESINRDKNSPYSCCFTDRIVIRKDAVIQLCDMAKQSANVSKLCLELIKARNGMMSFELYLNYSNSLLDSEIERADSSEKRVKELEETLVEIWRHCNSEGNKLSGTLRSNADMENIVKLCEGLAKRSVKKKKK